MDADSNSTRIPNWGAVTLAVAGFLGWAVLALLPALDAYQTGGPLRIREAWDTAPYFPVAVPAMALVQVAVAYFNPVRPWQGPLWLLGGHTLGMALIHPAGTSLGLLPLSILFVGVPLYVVFLIAALIGSGIARVAGRD
jgi:hypothetical protein